MVHESSLKEKRTEGGAFGKPNMKMWIQGAENFTSSFHC